jgi:hypothetical protein
MEKLDWMKTMSHRWMDGCLSADGQKTRVYENPCPTGGWMDGYLSTDGQKTRLYENPCPRGMYVPPDFRKEGLLEIWTEN